MTNNRTPRRLKRILNWLSLVAAGYTNCYICGFLIPIEAVLADHKPLRWQGTRVVRDLEGHVDAILCPGCVLWLQQNF